MLHLCQSVEQKTQFFISFVVFLSINSFQAQNILFMSFVWIKMNDVVVYSQFVLYFLSLRQTWDVTFGDPFIPSAFSAHDVFEGRRKKKKITKENYGMVTNRF